MNVNSFKFEKYIKKNVAYIKRICPETDKKFNTAVIIPVYNELDYFFKTLHSLSENDVNELHKTIIICVINNPENIDKNSEVFLNNQKLLGKLKNKEYPSGLNLHWIDCSSKSMGLSGKGGVGAARKIGMDTCLNFLDLSNSLSIICSLDADTLVQNNYLSEVEKFFKEKSDCICATVSFKHLNDCTSEEYLAVQDYEFYLNYYVKMLNFADSPYAYHAIGSAMAFTAEAYLKSGGMKVHTAGEDFYFLQSIRKIGKIGNIATTTVFQSSRSSDRVPFGTGPTVQNTLNGKIINLFNPKVFILLKDFLAKVKKWILNGEADDILKLLSELPDEITIFLEEYDFTGIWLKITENNVKINSNISVNESRNKLLWCFNIWFDSFRTLKFIHFLEKRFPEKYPRISIDEFKANNQFFNW